MSTTEEPKIAEEKRKPTRWLLLALLLPAAGLRLLAAGKSLWLDELHSTELAHASFRGLFELLRPDFHAPLFYYLTQFLAATGLDGESLRLLPGLVSLLLLLPFVALLRSSRAEAPAIVAGAAVLLLAPFQIRYGVELRPYSMIAFLSLITVWAVFDRRGSDRRRLLLFAGAAALGLYTHYLMAVLIVAVGAARLITPFGRRLPVWKVVAAGSLGVLLFLPWILSVESWLVTDPSVLIRDESADAEEEQSEPEPIVEEEHPARAFAFHRDDLIALPARCFAPGAASLGDAGRYLVLGGLGLICLLLLSGFVQSLLHADRRLGLTVWGPVLLAAIAMLITAALCVKIWERLGIQYFAIASWFWAFLAVIGTQGFKAGRPRRIAAALFVLAALLAGLGEAIGLPREDLRAAAVEARRMAEQEGAHLSAILRQPGHYSNIEIYRVYPGETRAVEPEDVPEDDRPVVVLTRSTSLETGELPDELIRKIRTNRVIAEKKNFHGLISVYLFQKRP